MTTTDTSPERRMPRLADEQGVRIGVAHAVLVVATSAAALLGLGHDPALVLLSATALAGGLVLSDGWAVLLGASCWAFWTGFLDHSFGQLTLTAPDLARLVVLVALAVAGSELGRRFAQHG